LERESVLPYATTNVNGPVFITLDQDQDDVDTTQDADGREEQEDDEEDTEYLPEPALQSAPSALYSNFNLGSFERSHVAIKQHVKLFQGKWTH